MTKRTQKNTLYEQVARIGKAVSSPKRLEILELLTQSEKTVETLTVELQVDVKLVSAHLRTLRQANLVTSRHEGKFRFYSLADPAIAVLIVQLRNLALNHLDELNAALQEFGTKPEDLTPLGREELLDKSESGEITLIDVRPADEYAAGHLPYARSLPVEELEGRLDELAQDKEIIAYCRGPFCLFADDAVALLKSRGFTASKTSDGIAEWCNAKLPLTR